MTTELDTDKNRAGEIADLFLKNGNFFTMEDSDAVFYYSKSEGIYKRAETFIKSEVERTIKDSTSYLVREVIGHIQRKTFKPRSILENTRYVAFENCLLNVETLQAAPFTAKEILIEKIHTKYDTKAKCPNFERFIQETLSKEDALGIQEELGAILYKKYMTKKLSIWLGETDTGKSTLVNTLIDLLGNENVSSVPLQQISYGYRFAVARIFGKLANITDDMSKDVVRSVGLLKQVTGSSQIQGENKLERAFDFVNHAFIIATTNKLPEVQEDDDAFWNRVVLRKFEKRFGGHSEPDKDLLEKLLKEKSGILNWGIEGLKRLKSQNWVFTNSKNIDEVRVFYRRNSDSTWAFVEDMIEANQEDFVEKQELFQAYRRYCSESKLAMVSSDAFFKKIPSLISAIPARRGSKGEQRYVFNGISLKPDSTQKSLDSKQVDPRPKLSKPEIWEDTSVADTKRCKPCSKTNRDAGYFSVSSGEATEHEKREHSKVKSS